MEKGREKKFKWRGMMTLMLVLAMLVDIVSGVILYITPLGRFANWTNWTLWGLNKHDWAAIHTIFSYLLVLVLVGHLYFNWRVLVHFVWSKIRNTLNLKWELAVASLIILFVFMGTLWDVQPFSAVMNFGEKMKVSWENGDANIQRGDGYGQRGDGYGQRGDGYGQRGVGYGQRGVGYGQRSVGYGRRASADLGHNENQNPERYGRVTPSIPQPRPVPYDGLGRRTPPNRGGDTITATPQVQPIAYVGQGRGFGRMTIDIICTENGLSLKEGLSRLKENGIEARGSDRLRDLANRSGRTPNEIFEIMRAGGDESRAATHSEPLPGSVNTHASALKGRDLVRLGEPGTLTGTLVQKGDEWGVQVGDIVYDIHLGPSEYRTYKDFHLKDGEAAIIKGFVYKKDVTVVSIETGGQSITLRDETGRPAWAGTGSNRAPSSF